MGGAAALAFAFALLALDRWQRAPQARPIEPEPLDAAESDDKPDVEPESAPVAPRRGAHRDARTVRARSVTTWSRASMLRIGRRRSLLRRPARKPRAALPVRPLLLQGRAKGGPE